MNLTYCATHEAGACPDGCEDAYGHFTVVLERRLGGSACGTTTDVIEARSEAEAVAVATRLWREHSPRFTFAPLLVAPALDDTEPSNGWDTATG